MATNLPYGAAEIVALRTGGKRPADMVLVSLVGPLRGESNPAVIARPERSYDWRWAVGLSILLIATSDTPSLAGTIRTIEGAQPATLAVWFADHQDGINVLINGYRPSTKAARRMDVWQRANYAGLGSAVSAGECLQRVSDQVKARLIANADRLDGALMEMATAGGRLLFGKAWRCAA